MNTNWKWEKFFYVQETEQRLTRGRALVASVYKHKGERVKVLLDKDPRTGKPWTGIKQAQRWLDSIRGKG
jgi:hypothetical protein